MICSHAAISLDRNIVWSTTLILANKLHSRVFLDVMTLVMIKLQLQNEGDQSTNNTKKRIFKDSVSKKQDYLHCAREDCKTVEH